MEVLLPIGSPVLEMGKAWLGGTSPSWGAWTYVWDTRDPQEGLAGKKGCAQGVLLRNTPVLTHSQQLLGDWCAGTLRAPRWGRTELSPTVLWPAWSMGEERVDGQDQEGRRKQT